MIILPGSKKERGFWIVKMLHTATMKKISKLRLFHSASSAAILAAIPAFLLVTFFAGFITTSPYSSLVQLMIYLTCLLGITVWIYNSDSEFQIYYCDDCSHEWSRKRHMNDCCPKCKSENYIYNYKPWCISLSIYLNFCVYTPQVSVDSEGVLKRVPRMGIIACSAW